MAMARSDIKVVSCGNDDERLLAGYAELDEEFYGFYSEDFPETISIASLFSTEDSDIEDAGTDNEFYASTAISRANCNEHDSPNLLMPVADEKLAVQAKLQDGCGCPHDCYKAIF